MVVADDQGKKVALALSASLVFVSGTMGVNANDTARRQVKAETNFADRLKAVRAAVESGDVIPVAKVGAEWELNAARDVQVADWQQTWNKVQDFKKVS